MRPLPAKFLGCVFALLVLAVASQPAKAGMVYSFKAITNNTPGNPAAGQSQLSVDVTEAVAVAGVNRVSFTFNNVGAVAMSITDVYFDDGTLLGISSITSSAGVAFTGGSASPGNLPGGSAINFNTTAGFLADSDSKGGGTQANGVNPGESLTVTFKLINSKTYADTIAALELSLLPANYGKDITGGLRIGIHVQGIANGGSESFVNGGSGGGGSGGGGSGGGGANVVPAPAGLVLLASAMPFAFGLRRWLNRREVAA